MKRSGLEMIYSREYYVPALMLMRRNGPAAGVRFVQQFKPGDTLNGKFAPLRKMAAALPADLIREKIHHAFLNAVILWLRDALLIIV